MVLGREIKDVLVNGFPRKMTKLKWTKSKTLEFFLPDTPELTEVRVTPEDVPEVEDDDVTQYVYLVAHAAAAGFQKETIVLLSANSHYVFIQTDKPLYTPRETGQCTLKSRCGYNYCM